MKADGIIAKLKSMRNERNIEKMKKFGIVSKAEILGIPKPKLRKLAKTIGKNTELALELWKHNIHEARILATMIANPKEFKREYAYQWIKDIDNWDLCDQFVMNLLWKTEYAHEIVKELCQRQEEFAKRAGFALIAKLAMSDKKLDDEFFQKLLPVIERESNDKRKYVRKAISWALRQIAKKRILAPANEERQVAET